MFNASRSTLGLGGLPLSLAFAHSSRGRRSKRTSEISSGGNSRSDSRTKTLGKFMVAKSIHLQNIGDSALTHLLPLLATNRSFPARSPRRGLGDAAGSRIRQYLHVFQLHHLGSLPDRPIKVMCRHVHIAGGALRLEDPRKCSTKSKLSNRPAEREHVSSQSVRLL